MKKNLLLLVFCTLSICMRGGSRYPFSKEVAWWQEARFGLFVHWGISSLMGQEISWSRGGYGAARYDSLMYRFNPTSFDADQWIDMAEQAGMKYIVLTAKHHDGFCLWDSKANSFNVMHTPYHRDICRQLADAAHRRGMRLGWYFSCREWSDPDCSSADHNDRYVEKMKNELRELLTQYGKVDLLWFDYDGWPNPAKPQEIMTLVRQLQPDIVVNNRLYPLHPDESHAYVGPYGMYATPEQFVGGYGQVPWETCSTMGESWQWSIRYGDTPRPADNLIWETMGAAAGNGNMLMNIGPDSLGVFPPSFAQRVGEVGSWIRRHDGILYGTKGGPWKPTGSYISTMKGRQAYLILHDGVDHITLPYASKLKIQSAKTDGGTPVPFSIQKGSITFTLPARLAGQRNVVICLQSGRNLENIEPLAPFSTSGSLAYDCQASASTSLNENYMHCPSSAFDDNDRTVWVAGRQLPVEETTLYGQNVNFSSQSSQVQVAFHSDATLQADLKQSQTVRRFVIKPRGGHRIAHVSLEYKVGSKWVEAAHTENLTQDWTGEIQPTQARYWRLNMQGGDLCFGITEFQLFAE